MKPERSKAIVAAVDAIVQQQKEQAAALGGGWNFDGESFLIGLHAGVCLAALDPTAAAVLHTALNDYVEVDDRRGDPFREGAGEIRAAVRAAL